jgi:hypothetical protein
MLQRSHGKGLFAKAQRKTTDRPAETCWDYMNRLIIVALSAKEVIDGAEKEGRLYFRVTRERINSLRRALEELRNPQ